MSGGHLRVGHNGGPTMEPGHAWRRHCWTEARRDLLPTLPLEVIRFRVRQAARLGIDYRAYASIRAGSNADIAAFLFSSNALRLIRPGHGLPPDRAEKLAATSAHRLFFVQSPLLPDHLRAACPGIPFAAISGAPEPHATWSRVAERVRALLAECGLPKSGVVVIGDAPWEKDWAAAGRLAGHLPAGRFFANDPG